MRNKLFYILTLLVIGIAVVYFFTPMIFLVGILLVSSFYILYGVRAGVISFVLTLFIMFLLPYPIGMVWSEFIPRLVFFVITSATIAFFNSRAVNAVKESKALGTKLQKETQINAERYKTFVANSEEAIWLVEFVPPIDVTLPHEQQVDLILQSGIVIEANPQMFKLYNVSEDIIGKPSSLLIPKSAEPKKRVLAFVRNDYTTKDWFSETREQNPNLKYEVLYGTTSMKGVVEHGKLARVWISQVETTEQKLQEAELERSKQRYQAFIEANQDAIWRVELPTPINITLPPEEQVDLFFKTGYIAEANRASINFLDVASVEDILNKPLETIGTRGPRDDIFTKEFIEQGYDIENYPTHTQEKGKPEYYLTTMKGIVENGYWRRAWVVFRDITKEKQYSIDRERLLQEARDANNEAEEANKEKDRFLATLSHELRTPLVSIVGYSGLLNENTDKVALKKGLGIINKNGKMQLSLIEELLDVSLALSNNLKLDTNKFNLKDVMHGVGESFKPKYEAKGIAMEYLGEDLMVTADEKRIIQIANNLVSNAVKFTNLGSVTLAWGETGNSFYFKVVDTGVGIEKEHHAQLFKRFYKVELDSTTAAKGVGLGLFIVKNLAELHNGTVTMESVVGVGSTFTVTIPKIACDSTKLLEGTRILLIDDDDEIRELLKMMFEAEGSTVVTSNNAVEGFKLARKNGFDAMVFDVAMPHESGIDLMKKIAQLKNKPPSVALSAYRNYEKEALESGFKLFILKPLDRGKIKQIKNLLISNKK